MERNTAMQTYVNDYQRYLYEEEKSSATIKKYLRDVRDFCVYARDETITKDKVMGYKQKLAGQQYAPSSINSMLASVNSFLEYRKIPECKVHNFRIQKNTFSAKDKELTRKEYLRLLEATGTKEWLKLVMQTICATGIRVSELKAFTVEAVQKGEVIVRCKSKTRIVFIPQKLRQQLLKYAGSREIQSGIIFITRGGKPLDRSYIWAQMKKLCKIAGVNPEKVYPHNLRKLFARTFYQKEKDIAKLSDLLGHSSIDTTRIYIMTTGEEHRKQVERLGLVI